MVRYEAEVESQRIRRCGTPVRPINYDMASGTIVRTTIFINCLLIIFAGYSFVQQVSSPFKDRNDRTESFWGSADGNYEVTLMTKATLQPEGLVIWEPPAIYKSSCAINVSKFTSA